MSHSFEEPAGAEYTDALAQNQKVRAPQTVIILVWTTGDIWVSTRKYMFGVLGKVSIRPGTPPVAL